MMLSGNAILGMLLLVSSPLLKQSLAQDNADELGAAAALFSGPVELLLEDPEFQWLESPVWNEAGNFLLFSDVKWLNDDGVTCGMIWKWDETAKELTKFLPCSGLIGPGDTPENIGDYTEAGSNGLYWGWQGAAAKDLLICQHGKHRIVRINLDDVDSDGNIDDDLVTVLVDSHNGTILNSPNDMFMIGEHLYFTDPPFGLQNNLFEDPIAYAFDHLNQDIGVYIIKGEPDTTPVEPERILNFGNPGSAAWEAPNGVAISAANSDLFIPVTDFSDPRFQVYASSDGVLAWDPEPQRLDSAYRIDGGDLPALNDGVTYSPGLDVFFGAGPGGIYMFNGTTYDLLGFLRLDDLVSNTVIGGGYLWLTVNMRLMRIPLTQEAAALTAGEGQNNPDSMTEGGDTDGEDNEDETAIPVEEGSKAYTPKNVWSFWLSALALTAYDFIM